MNILGFIKTHQQKIALSAGYILVAVLGIGIGRITALKYAAPDIKVEEVFTIPVNYSSNSGIVQSVSIDDSAQESTSSDCAGKIKGNISSKSKIYHVPGGAFYNRTNPEVCFGSEAEAKAAGFRKSSR